jgi:hypothetical protein
MNRLYSFTREGFEYPRYASPWSIHDLAAIVFIYSDAPECAFIEIETMCWELHVAAEHLAAVSAALEQRSPVGLRIIPIGD